MMLPSKRSQGSSPSERGLPRFLELLGSFLRATASPVLQRAPAARSELEEVTFERQAFWLAAPNVLNASGVPLIGFTILNGSRVRLSVLDIRAELYLDQERIPHADGAIRLRFHDASGLEPGARFEGVATMLMLKSEQWASGRVQDASSRRVVLRPTAAYDDEGRPLQGSWLDVR